MRTALTQEQAKQLADEAKAWIAAHNWQAELYSFEQILEIEEKECYLLNVAFNNGRVFVPYVVKRTAQGIESLLCYTYGLDYMHPETTQ